MRAAAAIGGYRGPLIFQNSRLRLAGVHHRLDRQHHTLAQTGAMAAGAEVGDLRLFVQTRPDSVPYELSHHAEAIGFDIFLDSRADVADRVPDPRLFDALIQRSLGNFEQLAPFFGNRSIHRNRNRGVAVIAIHHHAAVDRNDVAGFEHPLFGGDAVNNLFIDRSAEHARVIVISLKRRLRTQILHLLLGGAFQIHGGDSGSYQSADVIQHLANDAAAAPHLLDLR